MNDPMRGHEPLPSPEDFEWLDSSPLGIVIRALALAAVALGLGVCAAILIDSSDAAAPPPAAATSAP